MGFRIVSIKNRCKLEYSLNYLVVRSEKETKICIDEIAVLIVASTEVSLTASLLSALMNKNISVIFCDAKYNPQSQLLPFYGTIDTYKKIFFQIRWDNTLKGEIWKSIIQKKIENQAKNLFEINEEAHNKLITYKDEVEIHDNTNREGHSAKVYFNALFSSSFSRNQDNQINKFLDYGYSILLSAINREIKSFGYLTEIGIHHIGETNPFNLSCDFIEPLRPLVDYYVINKLVDDENFKNVFINMLNLKVRYRDKELFLENAIHSYVGGLLTNLRTGSLAVDFIEYEL